MALDGDFEDKIMLAKDILHVAGSSRNKKLNLLRPTQLPPTTETNDNSTLTQELFFQARGPGARLFYPFWVLSKAFCIHWVGGKILPMIVSYNTGRGMKSTCFRIRTSQYASPSCVSSLSLDPRQQYSIHR